METTPLSYAALAERLGKTVDAVRKIARRRGWRVSLDNRGKAIVHVPLADLEDTNPPATPATVEPPTTRPPPGGHMDAGALVDALTHERDRLAADLAEVRSALADALAEAKTARDEAHKAEVEAAELRGELRAVQGRGFWGKLLG
ncbi:hypothetical protein [Pararhodospirillum oryzae]|uniref:Uncharacterized protein n=1 Tax=Pararhodospirillum oryzae TaxID=478448 RepID=A0A512HAX1_9PROT|nr:hypothetical protein [Pararhodospirillum oryzae]GEO82592.1 hypothetical protein ROR02_27230 [Pararhodospirillum oryzae]